MTPSLTAWLLAVWLWQSVVSPAALQQINALMAEKAARTPAQLKLSSALVHALKSRRGEAVAPGALIQQSAVVFEPDGTSLVDLRAVVDDSLLARIEAVGGRVLNSSRHYGAVRAHVPVDQLESLAEWPEVAWIRTADEAVTNQFQTAKVNTSQGDMAHRASLARSTFGINGGGVGIGVLSDGVDSLAARQASGDLPASVTVLSGQAGSGDEGTAMLEIVYDLAPGSPLYFATARRYPGHVTRKRWAGECDGC